MRLTVEFFGIPRHLTGVKACRLDFATGTDLYAVVSALAGRFPRLVDEKIITTSHELSSSFMFSINGKKMVCDLSTNLSENDTLLLISSISGG